MNCWDGPLTHDALKSIVTDTVGFSLAEWFDSYVEGGDVPEIPEEEDLFAGDDLIWREWRPVLKKRLTRRRSTTKSKNALFVARLSTRDSASVIRAARRFSGSVQFVASTFKTNGFVRNVVPQLTRSVRSVVIVDIPPNSIVQFAGRGSDIQMK